MSKTLELSNDCIAGPLKQCSSQWLNITSDYFILDSVTQYKIKFAAGFPQQESVPREICFSLQEQQIIQDEIDKLLKKGVIKETTHCEGEYTCTIFIRPKKDGTYRLILNLKNLNEHVEYYHFKMDTRQSKMASMHVVACYIAAYFSIFYIKKQAFYSPSALYHEEDIKDRHETFIYSSLWSSHQGKGFQLRAIRESFCQILLLL